MANYINTLLLSFLLVPAIVSAATPNLQYPRSIITESGGVVSTLLTLVVGIALLLFFWGLAIFILKADDEQERQKGRQRMIWGIIALFVIVSVWGIVGLMVSIFGVNQHTEFGAPTVSNIPQ